MGGSSGAGKTTLVTGLLEAQSRGEPFLGHDGAELPYLILFADRGELSNRETLERMGFADRGIPIAHLPVCWGDVAVQRILAAIEARDPLPAAAFVEGADTLIEDPSKPAHVAPFLSHLQHIAAHYHVALILSVGSPKQKPQEQYRLRRDRIFGSQLWARMAETVALLSAVGDDTTEKRQLDVLHRNAKAESFALEFLNGRLVEATPVTDQQIQMQILDWARSIERFTSHQLAKAFPKVSGTRRQNILSGLVQAGLLYQKVRDERTIYVANKHC
jgi:hypothetical protein